MKKLTLLSSINACLVKCFAVSQILCSEINQKLRDDNFGQDVSIVNQLIPLLINDETAASCGNGVSVS